MTNDQVYWLGTKSNTNHNNTSELLTHEEIEALSISRWRREDGFQRRSILETSGLLQTRDICEPGRVGADPHL